MNDPNHISPMQRFWRLLEPERKEIRNVYVYAIFNGLIYLSLPLGIQAIVNLIQGGQVSTAWVVLVSVVVAGVAATGVLQIAQLRITENLQQRIFTRSAFEFAYRIPRIKMEAIYNHYAPELMNRFFDTVSVQKGLSKILIDFSTAVLQVLFGLILLSFYHPFFILFSLILILLVFAIFKFTGKKGLMTSLKESEHKYRVAHWIEELARTSTTFKLAGNTELPLKRMDEEVEEYLGTRESHFKTLMQQYWLMVVFKVLIAAGLLAMGGILVMQQLMNIGQFVAAEIIILLIMASVEKLVLSMETIYDVLTALEKIAQVTELDLEKSDGVCLEESEERKELIRLENVGFTYPEGDRKILESIDLKVKAGETIVLKGPNGSGKSTLLYLLAGLYDPTEGHASFDGQPIGGLDINSLRALRGHLFSDSRLFDGTIAENITVGRDGISQEDIEEVVKVCYLEDLVRTSAKGLNTRLEPNGTKLSRSIVQKLLLARSVVTHPEVLLLEDPFEHIDDNESTHIIDWLIDHKPSRSIVAVTTNEHFISRAQRALDMKQGKVILES